MPFQCAHCAWSKNEEPTLDELLAEPAVRIVMARDRVTEDMVRKLSREARLRVTSTPKSVGVTAVTISPAMIAGSP
jgi:hypothetical protein